MQRVNPNEGKASSDRTSTTDNPILVYLKKHPTVAQATCIVSIISCYGYQAYLQESLLTNKDQNLNTYVIFCVQSIIAMFTAVACLKFSYASAGFLEHIEMGDLQAGVY